MPLFAAFGPSDRLAPTWGPFTPPLAESWSQNFDFLRLSATFLTSYPPPKSTIPLYPSTIPHVMPRAPPPFPPPPDTI